MIKEISKMHQHILLYSKGWFKQKDPKDDLKKIMGHYMAIYPIHLSDGDVISLLLPMIFDYYINETQYFAKDRFVEVSWCFLEFNYTIHPISKMISLLSTVAIKDRYVLSIETLPEIEGIERNND